MTQSILFFAVILIAMYYVRKNSKKAETDIADFQKAKENNDVPKETDQS